jgi:dTDP-glucose 4,6-dehydratase
MDELGLNSIIIEHKPVEVMYFAAESDISFSIDGLLATIEIHTIGTYTLLEATHHYWAKKKARFRFHHICIDEVLW